MEKAEDREGWLCQGWLWVTWALIAFKNAPGQFLSRSSMGSQHPCPNAKTLCYFEPHICRERKMRTNFFCTNFLNTPRGQGHPGKIPGTSQIPLFETQGRQTFEGGHEVFGHHPFVWKTPTPPSGLRTQKVYLCAPFSCLNLAKSDHIT